MNCLHKRKSIISIVMLVVFICACCLSAACKEDSIEATPFNGLAVYYIDVGEGDATFIHLPNGKNMLIDTGAKSSTNLNRITSIINRYGGVLDYLVLSHPDPEHYGNSIDIIANFKIGKAFIPYVLCTSVYPSFCELITLLRQKEITTEISKTYTDLSDSDFTLLFLLPEMMDENNSYNEFNKLDVPNSSVADEISPVIYLEYAGVRFLFTADGGRKSEDIIINRYNSGIYDKFVGDGRRVLLEHIDFYKVSSHGGLNANSKAFLMLLSPKNAIISVGGGNASGHPSTEVLLNLSSVNADYNLFRTDRDSTVSVYVNIDGQYEIDKGK